jgi:hypothetical protein
MEMTRFDGSALYTALDLRVLFETDGAEIVRAFRAGSVTIHALYEWWDRCLVDDMLSDEGNAFAKNYFDFERGSYLKDYALTLQRDLESEFHVPFTEQNYQAIRVVIDQRYGDWQRASRS